VLAASLCGRDGVPAVCAAAAAAAATAWWLGVRVV
jgi:hypothetical protein